MCRFKEFIEQELVWETRELRIADWEGKADCGHVADCPDLYHAFSVSYISSILHCCTMLGFYTPDITDNRISQAAHV